MSMRHLPAISALALLGQATTAATIQVNHNGTPANAQAAIAHAASIWEGILISNVPIEVTVNWLPMGGLALGITLPNGERDFTNAPLADTWYASALANALADADLAVGEADFNIWLDAGADWYYGIDGDTPPGQYDLVSVALHEMGHGLGFVGLSKKEGAIGSFGLLEASDFSPLATDFPWPDLDSLPSIFDRFLAHPLDGPLTIMPNVSAQLGTAMTGSQVFFNGPLAMVENAGAAPEVYAPSAFALGSSCVHLDEAAFPAGDANELMTPFASAGSANHWPGPLCIAMLRDIGWNIAPDASAPEVPHRPLLAVSPVPASHTLNFTSPDGGRCKVTVRDAHSRILLTTTSSGSIDIGSLPEGVHHLIVEQDGSVRTARFIKHY